MQTIEQILSRIQSHCEARGIAESTFGRIAVNDGKFVARLRSGGTMTIRTLEQVENALKSEPPRSPRGRKRRMTSPAETLCRNVDA